MGTRFRVALSPICTSRSPIYVTQGAKRVRGSPNRVSPRPLSWTQTTWFTFEQRKSRSRECNSRSGNVIHVQGNATIHSGQRGARSGQRSARSGQRSTRSRQRAHTLREQDDTLLATRRRLPGTWHRLAERGAGSLNALTWWLDAIVRPGRRLRRRPSMRIPRASMPRRTPTPAARETAPPTPRAGSSRSARWG